MKTRGHNNYTDFLAGLLIFGVFAVGIIAVLLSGAGVYKRISERDSRAFDARVCTEYLTTKIRSAQVPSAVEVVEPETLGSSALKIRETVEGEEYATYVYLSEGWMSELFVPETTEPVFSAGEKLLELRELEFNLENGLLCAEIRTENDASRRLLLYVGTESGEEREP